MNDGTIRLGFDERDIKRGSAAASAAVKKEAAAMSAALGKNFGDGITSQLKALSTYPTESRKQFALANQAAREFEQRAMRIANLKTKLAGNREDSFNMKASAEERLAAERAKLAKLNKPGGDIKVGSKEEEQALQVAIQRETVLQNITRLELQIERSKEQQKVAAEATRQAEAQQASRLQAQQANAARMAAQQRAAEAQRVQLERQRTAELLRAQNLRRAEFSQNLAALEAEAAGRTRIAGRMRQEIALRREAVAIAKSLNLSERESLALAQRKIAVQERIAASERRRQGGSSIGGIAMGVGLGGGGVMAAMMALSSLKEKFRETADEGLNFAGLEAGLKGVLKSGEDVKDSLASIRRLANEVKGMNFDDIVRAEIALRGAGNSGDRAQQIIREFGNALNLVGRGDQLDGVITALNQINAKGNVFAEEINQIAERLPQIRVLMKDAFGTSDTEIIQKMNMNYDEFMDRLLVAAGKLPRAIGSIKTELAAAENEAKYLSQQFGKYTGKMAVDWQKLKNHLNFFAIVGAKSLLGGADFKAAMRDQERFLTGLNQQKAVWQKINTETTRYRENLDQIIAKQQSDQWTKVGEKLVSLEKLKDDSAKNDLERLQRVSEKLEAYRGSLNGNSSKDVLREPGRFSVEHVKTALEMVKLEQELVSLQQQLFKENQRATEEMRRADQATVERIRKNEAVRSGYEQSLSVMQQEIAIMEARNAGQDKVADGMERQLRLAREVKAIKEATNVSDRDALTLAERKLNAEDGANKSDKKESKIKGFKQEDNKYKNPFRGLDGHRDLQRGNFFDGMRTPGLDELNRLQQRDPATGARVPAFINGKPKTPQSEQAARNAAVGRKDSPMAVMNQDMKQVGQQLNDVRTIMSTMLTEIQKLTQNC